MKGQLNIFDYLESIPNFVLGGCKPCICKKCLYWFSGRCVYGKCYDDFRASENSYNQVHPDEQARTGWSDWNKPGEQEHWCRGGTFYPIYQCSHYKKYTGVQFEKCIRCDVVVYQDGHKYCCLTESQGCQVCYEELMKKMDIMESPEVTI